MKNIKLLLRMGMILVVAISTQVNGMQKEINRSLSEAQRSTIISMKQARTNSMQHWQGRIDLHNNKSESELYKDTLIKNAEKHRDNFKEQLNKLDAILYGHRSYSFEEIQGAGQTFGQLY